MEAGGDFVDELLHVLRAPVGAVMQCSASKRGKGEARSAMETLCGSVAQLRGPLFNSGNCDAVPAAYDMDEEKKVANTKQCQQCGQHVTLSQRPCARCGITREGCPQCGWCTHCSQTYGGQRLQVAVHQAQPSNSTFMKDTTKFIITKKLDVFESSSIRAITLLGATGATLQNVTPENVTIDTGKLRSLIGHALLNTEDILTATFPVRGARRRVD